jgi:hypothetical protein
MEPAPQLQVESCTASSSNRVRQVPIPEKPFMFWPILRVCGAPEHEAALLFDLSTVMLNPDSRLCIDRLSREQRIAARLGRYQC